MLQLLAGMSPHRGVDYGAMGLAVWLHKMTKRMADHLRAIGKKCLKSTAKRMENNFP
jgi:hypothetical protein